jgi:hypothetical protein
MVTPDTKRRLRPYTADAVRSQPRLQLLEVRPGVGIGPIRIGMTHDEARAAGNAAGLRSADFKRGANLVDQPASSPTDLSFGSQLFAYFNGGDVVEEVEVAVSGPLPVALFDVDLGAPSADVLRAMQAHGRVDETDPEYPSTSAYVELGLSLWADVTVEDLSEVSVEAVLVRRSEP